MKESTRILIVEDKSADADLAKHTIQKVLKDCEFQVVETRADFLNALEIFQPEVILSDYSLPRFDGMKALNLALKHAPLTPLIIWTGSISEDVAVECMKAGANNYILKDNIKRLGPALIHALDERQLLLERKQVEEALQNSEKRFRALIENGQDNISLLKADGTLIWESPATSRMLDYAPDEFIGRDIFDLIHPEDMDWTRGLYIKLIQEPGSHQRGTFRLRRSDSTWRWVDAIVTNMLNEPSVNAIVVNYRDITEQKLAEEALRESENRLILALSGAQMSVWEWNLQTNSILWSPEFFEITGVKEDNFGRTFESFTNLVHTEDVARVMASAERAVTEKSLFAEEFRIIRPDGEVRWISNLGHAEYDSINNYLRLIGTVQDITPRKQVELERQALLEIMQGLANTTDLQELLKLIHDSIAKVIFARNFFVVLHNEKSGLFEEIYSVDQYDPPAPPAKLEKSITSYIFRRGESLLLTQEGLDELIAQGETELVGTNSASWLGAPLKTSGKTIGVIAVQDYENPNRYSEYDREFLTSIASQTALAINHRQAVEAVRESEERYRALFEDMPVAVWEDDLSEINKYLDSLKEQGIRDFHRYFETHPEDLFRCRKLVRILNVNKAALELYQAKSKEELIQSTLQDMGKGELEYWINDLTAIANGETTHQWEGEDETMNDTPIEISLSWTVVPGHENDYSKVIFTTVDITERKQAEEALHKSEAIYRQAIEAAGAVPYYESYLDKGRLIKYEFIGEGIRQITGYGPEEFNETLWDSLVEEVNLVEDLEGYSLNEGIQQVRMGENSNWKCEHRLRDRDGKIHWVFEAAVELRDENGISYGSIGTYQDITKRKLAEQAEREQRALAEALRDTAETLSSSLSYEEVLDHILAAVGRVVPHDAATIMLIDGESAYVVRSYGYDKRSFDFEIIGIELPLAETNNLRQMLETGKTVLIHDTHLYPGWMRLPVTDWLRSNVGAPISIQGKVIGFILLDSQTPGFFAPVHAERLEAFANQAALAIQNARLLKQAQEEITERKRAEAALRAEREKAQNYLDIAGVMMLALDPDGIVTLINQKGCEMLGYPADEIIGKDWIKTFLPKTINEELQGVFQQLISGDLQSPGYYENTVMTKNGEERLIAWHNTQVRDSQGIIISTLSSGEDITERKRAEAQLRASEERFRQLADNIEEAFWMTDAESDKEIYLSQAAEVIWERPLKSLTSEPNAFINTVFPEDQSAILHAIEKEKSGKKVEIEYRIIRPDGSVRWVWDRAFPIFDDSGKVGRIAGITADITERRESEIALRQSQGRYRELFDSSPISIWEEDYSLVKKQIDLLMESGVTDLGEYFSIHPDEVTKLASLVRVTDINKAALELYQVEHKEDLLDSLTQVMDIEALSHFEEEILGLMSPLRRFIWEGADKTINGRQMEVIVNGSIPEGYEEDWSKVIISIIDITDRREAEQQLRKLSRAVEQSGSTIVITDTSGNIEYVNPKFTEITGYTFEEVLGQNPRILKSGFTSDEVYKQLWQTVISGKEWHGELLNKKKNDELYWEYVTISPIFNERGEITHFVGVKEDITQRKQSEVETQRHLTELEALYENGLAVGRLLTANEIGNRMINTFARYLQWHHVTIRLRKEESEDLELVAFNLPGVKDEERVETELHFAALINKVGQGLSGWVIQSGISLRTGNVHTNPQYIDSHPGIKSGLYMPLRVGEQVIGVISVESEMPDAFTEQDERLLATLANQAAIAFENARLYETIQKELVERKRMEQDLRASEVHYRELADSITDILFELDQDLHYTHWNRASELLTGIPARDAIGKSMYEIFGESEEQTRIRQIYEGVLKNRQPRTFETLLLLNRQKRSFEINAYPSTRGVSVVAKDVTERKQSEIIMQKRFELMEFSAHHTLDELMQKTTDEVSELTGSSIGFFHFVDEDHTTLRRQTWSTNALQLFHVPVSEGVHLPLDQAGVWAEAARQRRPLIQSDYETLAGRKGLPQGHVPITREIVIPIIRNERIMAIMGIGNKPQDYTQSDLEIAERLADYAWDITERKQMEIALEAERNQLAQRVDERTADLSRANSNLARALRVKDEFLANMSHELRTPLNAILGLSESLGEQIAGPLNEKQQKYIATIGESGHHLLSLINDILDLAKIDAGQITLDINKVDIHSVCQASLRMIKQLAQKKNQEVSLEIDEGLGVMWADERRLKQMIVNLLGNAVKFTPENGKLGLEVHGDEEANKISFTVWDKGIGIKEEDLVRLFQPFVQLDSGLARETTGTGLGLALVAQMARLHGGSITTASEPENGSRFTIILPWEPALAMDAAARMKITGKFRAIKLDEKNKPVILLVEDTKEVTMMIRDYLELTGYKVVTAQDGVDAIVQAKLVRPDLILMDVQMPRMDGIEATRKLRSEPNFRYTPIIALTALAMPSDRERCLEAGMDEYISKPVNLKALVKIIQGCLFSNQEIKSR
jgi:PAS domain S-box-containing protein